MTLMDLPVKGFMASERLWWLLLVPVMIALYVWLINRKSSSGIRFTNTGVLGRVLGKQNTWLRHVTVALSILSLITLIGAWGRPFGLDRVPRNAATIVVVIDVSLSMEATDVSPNRLAAAKQAAAEFTTSVPAAYNLSLVSLSGSPAVRLPPVTDRAAMLRAIERLEPQESTAIGDAIYAALGSIDQAPKVDGNKAPPGMIVMLSDGTNTAGQAPLQAAADAGKRNVPIYTIAYGTDNGYVDLDGKRERVPPDKQTMSKIAQETKGRMYEADNLAQLNDAYKSIQTAVGYVEVEKEITATAAGVGLALALLAAIGAVMVGARWP